MKKISNIKLLIKNPIIASALTALAGAGAWKIKDNELQREKQQRNIVEEHFTVAKEQNKDLKERFENLINDLEQRDVVDTKPDLIRQTLLGTTTGVGGYGLSRLLGVNNKASLGIGVTSGLLTALLAHPGTIKALKKYTKS